MGVDPGSAYLNEHPLKLLDRGLRATVDNRGSTSLVMAEEHCPSTPGKKKQGDESQEPSDDEVHEVRQFLRRVKGSEALDALRKDVAGLLLKVDKHEAVLSQGAKDIRDAKSVCKLEQDVDLHRLTVEGHDVAISELRHSLASISAGGHGNDVHILSKLQEAHERHDFVISQIRDDISFLKEAVRDEQFRQVQSFQDAPVPEGLEAFCEGALLNGTTRQKLIIWCSSLDIVDFNQEVLRADNFKRQLLNDKLEEAQRMRALKFLWSEVDTSMLLEAEEQCGDYHRSSPEHDTLQDSVIQSELSQRRREVRASVQKALGAADLHAFVGALAQTPCDEQEEHNAKISELNMMLDSLARSKSLGLVSNEDRKLLRQHWDKHVQNARISDIQILRETIPHTSVFDVADPWCRLPAAAKVSEKVSQLEQKEQVLQSVMTELTLASNLQSLRKAMAKADRVFVSEKLLSHDMEQWQDEICQAVRNAIGQAVRACELHDFRKDKHVWSLGDGKWWSADLEQTWKAKVRECELLEKTQLEAVMDARREAAKGRDCQALEKAIAEAEKIGAPVDAIANAKLHELKSQFPWGWR